MFDNFFKKAREPMSSFTHLIGFIVSIVALILMVLKGVSNDVSSKTLFSVSVFGVSLIALYFASSYYHFYPGDEAKWMRLRKLDHSMIYVLIVGTYTPIVLSFVEGNHGIVFISILWIIAIIGIIVKIFWINAPRFLSTLVYLILGWAVVFDFSSFSGMPTNALILIAIGGISYSIGAILYIIKKPNIFKSFGFHEIFHIFIMIGSFFHFLAVYLYVL